MRESLIVCAVLGTLGFWGCQQDAVGPESSSAEVPAAGPAINEDPGPAPDGQWEPPPEEAEMDGPVLPPADTPASGAPTKDESSESSTESPPTSSDGSVSLKLQTWEETEQLIASHRGKVVVVDFWATSCLPCRREFPHLVELQESFGKKVACVSVSLDYSGRKSKPPQTYHDPVLKFLTEQGATFDNVLSTDDPDAMQQRLELPPIPLVWVFDQTGERRKAFHNGDLEGDEFTYADDVVPFVSNLLTEN